ncbi:hypothetical protein HGRIS_010286 [Hohenbuehelia grisea]|uniref:Fungal-type protein kinase domain-containing protein n=1 Tax=Hohenbuehelia grisea TaxID=104357 RepID=A0ABR3J3U0_9AGAR
MENIKAFSSPGVSSFISHTPPSLDDIQDAIVFEPYQKVEYNSPRVLQLLRTSSVSSSFLDTFLQDFDNRNAGAISALKDITEMSQNLDTSTRYYSRPVDEFLMHPHLQKIFDDVANFDSGSAAYSRRFYDTRNAKVKGEHHNSGFPSVSPDFGMRHITNDPKDLVTWRSLSCFLEVKPTSSQPIVPKNPNTTAILRSLAQTANYGRLHMSSRPFQLFSIGMMISGSKFAVAIFDRSGVMVSDEYDMWFDIRIFVQVIRQLACGLSSTELGEDPSAQVLDEGSKLYPAIPNIDEIYILKNAWRRNNRDSEADIYQSIPSHPSGVAEFLQGGDVFVPGSNEIIRADTLRISPGQPCVEHTSILHRLVLRTTGQALWDASTFLDIVKGIRAAVKGHRRLYSQGILHRDISPGNVLLSLEISPRPGEEGFLTDLEFAHVQNIVKPDAKAQPLWTGSTVDSRPVEQNDRGVMTGTLQFMATQLVQAMESGVQVEHTVHHDMESFIWVLAYSVTRRVINLNSRCDQKTKKRMSQFFKDSWGGLTPSTVTMSKRAQTPLQPAQQIRHLYPDPILRLFDSLALLVWEQIGLIYAKMPYSLSYEGLLGALDGCIAEFEAPAYQGSK